MRLQIGARMTLQHASGGLKGRVGNTFVNVRNSECCKGVCTARCAAGCGAQRVAQPQLARRISVTGNTLATETR